MKKLFIHRNDAGAKVKSVKVSLLSLFRYFFFKTIYTTVFRCSSIMLRIWIPFVVPNELENFFPNKKQFCNCQRIGQSKSIINKHWTIFIIPIRYVFFYLPTYIKNSYWERYLMTVLFKLRKNISKFSSYTCINTSIRFSTKKLYIIILNSLRSCSLLARRQITNPML